MDLLHPTFHALYFSSSVSAGLSCAILHTFYIQVTRLIDKMAPKILIVLTSQEKFEDKNGVTLEDKPTGWFLVRRFITKSPLY